MPKIFLPADYTWIFLVLSPSYLSSLLGDGGSELAHPLASTCQHFLRGGYDEPGRKLNYLLHSLLLRAGGGGTLFNAQRRFCSAQTSQAKNAFLHKGLSTGYEQIVCFPYTSILHKFQWLLYIQPNIFLFLSSLALKSTCTVLNIFTSLTY